MGNRANFVIVKDQDWQLYYSHWGGCRMLDALIGGPNSRCGTRPRCGDARRPSGATRRGPTAERWWISTVAGSCSSASR
jgi:hypothetical protein